MEQHALAILGQDDLALPRQLKAPNSALQTTTPKFLYHVIKASQSLGGTALDQFWTHLGTCTPTLAENIARLREEDVDSAHDALCRGLDLERVDLEPVRAMARAFLSHLGVGFLNSTGRTSEMSSEYSVSDALAETPDDLSRRVHDDRGSEEQKRIALEALAFQRDGSYCLVTHKPLQPVHETGYYADLVRLVPYAVEQRETLECIAVFAGEDTRREVEAHLDKIGNVMNVEVNARIAYDEFRWAIEAVEEGGEVKYFFRMVPSPTEAKPLVPEYIALKDGDEIQFGKGPEGEAIAKPIPRLCNLRLAVARVLRMSGAADILLQWEDADDRAVTG